MSEIIQGDCLNEMHDLEENSVDSVVTDPPYGLAFMGKSWDDFKPKEFQEFSWKWGKEALRVLKPGGYLLAFSGTRTYHRMVVGLEDAGFEIKDQIDWLYGSGFPKSTSISKQFDKRNQNKEDLREFCDYLSEKINQSDFTKEEIAGIFDFDNRMVSHWAARESDSQPYCPNWKQWQKLKDILDLGDGKDKLVMELNGLEWADPEVVEKRKDSGNRNIEILGTEENEYLVTKPETEQAKKWDGWGPLSNPPTSR